MFLAVPALALMRVRQQGDPAGRADAKTASLVVAGFAVGFMPHMVIKTLLYGRPWDTGYEELLSVYFYPRPIDALFSSLHGMFSWTPILLFATIGFAFFARKDREFALILGIPCLALYALTSGWQNLGVAASSFGNRLFISATVFFTLGLVRA